MKGKRKKFTPEFKVRPALEALRGDKTVAYLPQPPPIVFEAPGFRIELPLAGKRYRPW